MFHATDSHQTPQITLAATVVYSGIGPFDGRTLKVRIRPADPDNGIVFVRTDVAPERALIPVRWSHTIGWSYGIELGNAHGVKVAYAENVLAALQLHNIDNAIIELNGRYVPVPDGGPAGLGAIIQRAGTTRQWLVLPGIPVEEQAQLPG